MSRGGFTDRIKVVGASEHNLRNLSLDLPRDTLTVFTGVSGSGKSSLAFDTIFKEGQRRFLESLSPYARQFLGPLEKPRVEHVEGLSPTISIDQKTVNRNPRSTVGTITELYDLYRLLFARFGQPHCPKCEALISSQTPEQISDHLFARFGGAGSIGSGDTPPLMIVFAPMVRERKGEYRKELADWAEQGYLRARIDGEIRRLDEEPIELRRYEQHTLELVLDRFTLSDKHRGRLAEAVENGLALAQGLVVVAVDGEDHLFSSQMTCVRCQVPIPELEPRLFSFNAPQGACEACEGLGQVSHFSEAKLIDATRPIRDGAFQCFSDRGRLVFTDIDLSLLVSVAEELSIDSAKLWGKLPPRARRLMLEGNAAPNLHTRNVFRNPRQLLDRVCQDKQWPGLVPILKFIGKFVGSALDKYQETSTCEACDGRRLNPVALAVTFRGLGIDQLVGLTIAEANRFFGDLELNATEAIVGKDIFREIRGRLEFLDNVGVGYLTLARSARTLSGGEAQRIRLASQVGSGLQGVLYVLDEPSIGLHQVDNRRLIETLRRLRDTGNTVFVMEHDEETIWAANHVVDLGPGAGHLGGKLLAWGTPQDVRNTPDSLTGRYLARTECIELPAQRRSANGKVLAVRGAKCHNLASLDVDLPLGLLIAVTGVSGSGKSTLVHEVVKPAVSAYLGNQMPGRKNWRKIDGLEHLDKVIEINQAPIGRTSRSNPGTYTKVLDGIRQLFAQVPEARIRGYKPGRFSFNVKGGRCEACEGAGIRTIEMQFLGNVEIGCDECSGKRFNEETLQVRYKGKSITDVLEMTVDEAAEFFTNIPAVRRILVALQAVGLGYIHLGQSSTTLSGGEAQRVKLASELRKVATGRTLYLLDEPTTGLHFHDIRTLLASLNQLVDQGNTVLVIEHNLDVIKVADHVIDLGPGGGQAGGRIVCAGAPEAVAQHEASQTGNVLRSVLNSDLSASMEVAVLPSQSRDKSTRDLRVQGAEKNNLKCVDVTIPHNSLTVITGPSGSGKTSLAFDTIFAEGQARYVESLSTYARRFLGRMDKARVDKIEGLAPAIAIDQKNSGRSPRSTVATITEIYDYLRLLYARIGTPHCPECGSELLGYTPTRLARELVGSGQGERLIILAPLYRPGSTQATLLDTADQLPKLAPALVAEGFLRVRVGLDMQDLATLEGDPREVDASAPPCKPGSRPGSDQDLRPRTDTAIDLVVDRLKVSTRERKRLAEALEVAFEKGQGLARLHFPDQEAPGEGGPAENTRLVSEIPGCVACDYYQTESLTPRAFSFNSHLGACPTCVGLGRSEQIDPGLLVPFPERPLFKGALVPGRLGAALSRPNSEASQALLAYAKREGIDLRKPFGDLSKAQRRALLLGDGKPLQYRHRRGYGRRHVAVDEPFKGLAGLVERRYRVDRAEDRRVDDDKETWLGAVLANVACRTCSGERLRPEIRAVTLEGRNVSTFCRFTVEEAIAALAEWKLSPNSRKVAEQPLREIHSRLKFLRDVGLGYLNLDREAATLSGGEAQRIRLASQIGSFLVGVLYVLDEPTIGLHARDTARLLGTLKRLRELGNTVLVVEHDPETIRSADYVIDIGPGAGRLGGEVVAVGKPQKIARNRESLTGNYLAGRLEIPLPAATRSWEADRAIRLRGCRANNLRGIDVLFPLGTFIAVTGVSGSGKSSLVVSTLQPALERHLHNARVVPGEHTELKGLELVDKVVVIDQSAIGKSPKSNPATYTGVMDSIRNLMAAMPEAKVRGYKPGRFSFNVKGGRCEACEGRGLNHIEMHFLADVWVPCDACGGRRYNWETLQVRFRGRNIAEILDMEIEAAAALFSNHRRISRTLQTLVAVGLGYMKLGQAAHTLSGGEAQRIKLAAELGRLSTGRTVYILDEPTTGLHMDDTGKLLKVLHRLVDEGNTVIVIEHNLDVIKTADHVIDLGPEGGDAGGQVVATGSPAHLAAGPYGHTGTALVKYVKAWDASVAADKKDGTKASMEAKPALKSGTVTKAG